MKRELGTFERVQVITDPYAPFHIVGVLCLENAPAPHIVKKSLTLLQERHPFLSASIIREKGRHYFANLVEPPLPFHNLPRWNNDHWRQIAEVELANRSDTITAPMFQCTYLYNESRPHAEIILTLSHLIADAASINHLLHELMTICASLADGMPVSVSQLPPAPPLESRFPAAFRGWRLTLRTLRYVLAQIGDEIAYRLWALGKQIPSPHKRPAREHILLVQLPEDLVRPFAQRASKEGVTLDSALNAALLLSVNRHLYSGKKLPMRTFSFADLRPQVEPPLHAENLGLYHSMMRYTINVEGGAGFWPLARGLHQKIYASLKAGDNFVAVGMAEPLMKIMTGFKALRLGASSLSYNGVCSLQARYGGTIVLGVHEFVSACEFGPRLTSQAQIFEGQLFWDFIYLKEDISQEKAGEIAEEIKGIMKSSP